MPSTYSPNLRIELIANGEQSGSWGTTTNTNLGTVIEDAVAGYVSVLVTSANQALTAANGSADQSRNAIIDLTTSTAADFSVYIPPVSKLYLVRNSSAYTATIYCSTSLGNTTAAGTGVAIPAGKTCLIWTEGTNVSQQINYIAGALEAAGTFSVTGSAYLGLSQTATITAASPAVVTVAASPANDTAVRFTTTGTLPSPLVNTTTYYVVNRTATTFNVATSIGGSAINTVSAGSGTHTVTTVSLASTAPAGTNNTQIATTGFVNTAIANTNVSMTNWAINETYATQTATMTIASPAVVTVAASPANGTAVSFSTTGALPTGITADAPYYVYNRTDTTYQLSTAAGISQEVTVPIASPGVVTIEFAPNNGSQVVFSTTGTLPTGITAGTFYYVVNRTDTTFEISATAGGASIDFTGTESGTHTVTAYTPVNTSGSQSGVHTETTSKLYFKYKSQNRMSVDLAGNAVLFGNVTAFGNI